MRRFISGWRARKGTKWDLGGGTIVRFPCLNWPPASLVSSLENNKTKLPCSFLSPLNLPLKQGWQDSLSNVRGNILNKESCIGRKVLVGWRTGRGRLGRLHFEPSDFLFPPFGYKKEVYPKGWVNWPRVKDSGLTRYRLIHSILLPQHYFLLHERTGRKKERKKGKKVRVRKEKTQLFSAILETLCSIKTPSFSAMTSDLTLANWMSMGLPKNMKPWRAFWAAIADSTFSNTMKACPLILKLDLCVNCNISPWVSKSCVKSDLNSM